MSDDRRFIRQLTVGTPDLDDVIPAQDPAGGSPAFGVTPRILGGLHLHDDTHDPGVGDDLNDGHYAGQLWRNTNSGNVWQCWSAAAGAAVWVPYGSTVTGLTNPLAESLNAANRLIYSAAFAGFVDRYYDLGADSSGYVTGGVATLTRVYNAYQYPDLAEALEIILPDASVLAAADAPFGIITVSLADGGSVTIAQDEDAPWQWEKASVSESEPVLPTDAGSLFRLRYAWDPIAEAYAVSVSYLEAPEPVVTDVTLVAGSEDYTTVGNTPTTKSHTHTFVSDTQDGTMYLIVGFIADGAAAPTATPTGYTAITSPPTNDNGTQPQGHWGYIKPSQSDLNAGTLDVEFDKDNESAHIITFEVVGAKSDDPVGGTAYDRSSNTTRTNIGPVQLTPATPGYLLVAALGLDVQSGTKPDISVGTANGFTTLLAHDGSTDGVPDFIVAVLAGADAEETDSPAFLRTADGTARTQLEAFSLAPNA